MLLNEYGTMRVAYCSWSSSTFTRHGITTRFKGLVDCAHRSELSGREKKKNHDHDRHYHPNEVPIAMRQLNFET